MHLHCFPKHQRSPQCLPSIGHHAFVPYFRSRATRRAATIAVAARPKVVPEESSVVERLERSLQLPASAAPECSQQPLEESTSRPSSKRTVDEAEVLHSKNEHRAWVFGPTALMSAVLFTGLSKIHSWQGAAGSGAAVLAAYYVSDFLTGVYHWSVDNYGDGSTPVVGSQIAAFQGHHQKPWTITEREFCNNVYKVFMPAAPFAALCLLASPWTPAPLDVFLSVATFLTCMSQQFHAWAHMKKSELPAAVDWLQERGVLVSRKVHGAHHKAPFEGNYCIVSGFWNPILDADGSDASFFRRLERFVLAKTGVEPRCWHEPDYSWQEAPDAPIQGRSA